MPHVPRLERRFRSHLKHLGYDARQSQSLVELTLGAVAPLLRRQRLPAFYARIGEAGRQLANCNIAPDQVLARLREYDDFLEEILVCLDEHAAANSRRAREQLHICIVLSLNSAYYHVREVETKAFRRLLGLEVETGNLDQLYLDFVAAMAEFCHAQSARLYLSRGAEQPLTEVSRFPPSEKPGTPIPLTAAIRRRLANAGPAGNGKAGLELDPRWKRQFKSTWSVPITENGRVAGFVQFGFKEADTWLLPRELELLGVAAESCLRAADRARLLQNLAERETRLQALATHMLQVEEMERRRISRELHDDAGQSLVCIRLQLELTEGEIPEELAEIRQSLAEVRVLTEKTILDIRRLISDLSPAVLEQLGLGAAVRQLINRFQKVYPCSVRLHVGKLTYVPQKVQIVTYRLLQECCNNIANHSQAANVNISVTSADRVLKLNVSDDGVGFEVEGALAKHKSFGLAGMRERVALLGGRFLIRSEQAAAKTRNSGTEIQIELPIPLEESALP